MDEHRSTFFGRVRRNARCLQWAVLGVASLALFLVSCSETVPQAPGAVSDTLAVVEEAESESPGLPQDRTEAADTGSPDDTEVGAVAEASPESPSPIARAFGIPIDPLGQREATMRQRDLLEEHIASCMIQEGWTYFPFNDLPETFAYWDRQEGLAEEGSFNPEGGYGVAIGFGAVQGPVGEVLQIADPNQAIIDSLDDDELLAYATTIDACIEEAPADNDQPSIEFPQELVEPYAAIDGQVLEDPRYTAAWDQWSICLAREGFEFRDRTQIIEELEAQMQPIFDSVGREGPDEIPAAMQPLLEQTQALENDIAIADAACSVDIGEVERQLRWEYEELFLEEYSDLIAAMRAELETESQPNNES